MPRGKEDKRAAGFPHPGLHLLGELLHAHLALLNLFSREVGISPARLNLLHELLHAGRDGIGLTDLALRLGVTPALVTRQVKELEGEGWLRRLSDPRDGRRSLVCLSARGEAEGLKLHERGHFFEAALTEGLDPEDVAATVLILSNMTEKLESWRRTGRRLLDAAGDGQPD